MKFQGGFALIEIIVAMALLGILGIAVPSALSGANHATITVNKHTTAESLARSQMDYIQHQPYDSENSTPVYAVLNDISAPYNIATPMAARLDPKGDGFDNDDGLQQITVSVQHGTETVFELVDFKVNLNP